ncbi:hypothetical protein quinque_004996 [Culex quinquefasciatus]
MATSQLLPILLVVVAVTTVTGAKFQRAINDDVEFITPNGGGLGPVGLGPLGGPRGFRGIEILPRPEPSWKAGATLVADNPEQQIMGTISFRQWAPGHVETAINATGLPVGKHAVHVHAFGDMKEGCKSTGPHFRSSIIGNIEVKDDGNAMIDFHSPYVNLFGFAGIIGRSIVIHEKPSEVYRFPDLSINNPVSFQGEEDTVGVTMKSFLDILASKNITVAKQSLTVVKSGDGYDIKSVFRYTVNGPLIEDLIGSWQNEILQMITPSRKLNLGVILKAAIVCNSSADQSATMVNVELTKQLAFLLNVTINFVCFKDWEAARQGDHVDLIVTPTYMTTERLKQVHFLAMTGPLDYKFIFRSPKLSYTHNVFAVAFHYRVWLSILGLILLATVLQVVIIRVDRAVVHPDNPRDRSFAGVLLSMISLASQQEVLIASRTISSRTLSVVMLFSLMFLYISFSANIVGLIQSPSRTIRTLGDLRASGMELTVQDDRINRIFIGVSHW